MSDPAVPELVDEFDGSGERLLESDRLYLTPAAQGFWTGHSARATLSSWAASLGISKSRRDFIGRWRPEDSDQYVRTAMDILKDLHEEVASKIRQDEDGDVCHEQGLFKELEAYCAERGVQDEAIKVMVSRLSTGRRLRAVDELEEAEHHDFPGLSSSEDELQETGGTDGTQDLETQVLNQSQFTGLSEGCYVVSQTKAGASETLHQVGKCWRRPGVHYRRFIVLDSFDEVMANLFEKKQLYGRVCRECFPKGLKVEFRATDSTDSSSASTSESDSEINA